MEPKFWYLLKYLIKLELFISLSIIIGTASVFFITTMAMVSKFPKQYLVPYLFGEGYSGVIVSLLSLITLTMGHNPEQCGLIYFSAGVTFLIVTIILLWYSKHSRIYIYYMENNSENSSQGTNKRCTSFSEIMRIVKNIWPCVVIFDILLGTLYALQPALTALVVSENYGYGNPWNGEYRYCIICFDKNDM